MRFTTLLSVIVLLLILGLIGGGVGWLVATWLGPTTPNSRIISVPTTQSPTRVINTKLGIQVDIPSSWTVEISEPDPFDLGNIDLATKFEAVHSAFGQDDVQVSFTKREEIPENTGNRAELTTYSTYEAQMIEITTDTGVTEKNYYLRKSDATNYVVISIRSHGEEAIEQELTEIEQSFKLLGES